MSANNIKEMLKQGGINMKLVPLGDRVVLKQIVAEKRSEDERNSRTAGYLF